MLKKIKQGIKDLNEIRALPKLQIDLMSEMTKGNHPFFFEVIKKFYDDAYKPHSKMRFIPAFKYGISVCELPNNFNDYFMAIDASARRNVKKSKRSGYTFHIIKYNDHLDDLTEIHHSTDRRQGKMSNNFMESKVTATNTPDSTTAYHGYPCFGVMKDDKVYAYADCLLAGEMILLATIFGHDKYKSDGIVPQLIAGIAEYALVHYPHVKYFVYDKHYGGGENLRRFKRKFRFSPYIVEWKI